VGKIGITREVRNEVSLIRDDPWPGSKLALATEARKISKRKGRKGP